MAANLYTVTAANGQTVFNLPFSYVQGSNELFSYYNGQLMYVGVSYDETSPTQVTLSFSAVAGEQYTFRIPPGVFTGFNGPTQFSFAPPLTRPAQGPLLTYP